MYFYAHLVGRLASLGAMTLLKLICFSAGGPFLGCPLMITESPERTFNDTQNPINRTKLLTREQRRLFDWIGKGEEEEEA